MGLVLGLAEGDFVGRPPVLGAGFRDRMKRLVEVRVQRVHEPGPGLERIVPLAGLGSKWIGSY